MKFLTNLTLGKKITLLTTLGLIVVVGLFSFLAMRAVNQATEAMLQDRLTTARLVADYVDEALGRALTELENTAQMIESGRVNDSFEAQIEVLQDTYSRLSIDTHGIYLLNEQGQIMWSKPRAVGAEGINFSFYPGINQAIGKGEITKTLLVPLKSTN